MSSVCAYALATSRTRRTLLHASAAAAALLAVPIDPANAAVQDEEPLTIVVGDVFTSGYAAHGVVGVTTSAPVTVEAGTVVTEGPVSHGIATWSETGSTTITAGAVGTFGEGSIGIAAQSRDGDVTVNVGQVLTIGELSDAVIASSDTGDVNVTIGSTRTEGEDAWGLWAVASVGEVNVKVGSVETLRDGGVGLVVGGGAGSSVAVDSIVTSGYGASGVRMIAGNNDEYGVTFGDAVLRARTVETRGAQAAAVSVVAVGNADLEIGSVRTHGEFSDGVTSYSRMGDSRVVVGSVHTSGFGSAGIVSVTDGGDLRIDVAKVVTGGGLASGVRAIVRTGDLDLTAGDVATEGASSHGLITTVMRGDATLVAGNVQTRGAGANGIMAVTAGHTSITAGDVRTFGAGANGIDAFSAWAEWGVPNDRSLDIAAGSITTLGDKAHGINVAMPEDGVIIGSAGGAAGRPTAAVVTAEAAGRPAAPPAFSDDVSVRAGTIAVEGEGSIGIRVQGLGGVAIEADHVASQRAEAISVEARGGATIKLNGAVLGGGEAGVRITGADVKLQLGKSATVTGVHDAVVLSGVGPWVPPQPDAVAPGSPGTVLLENAGVIRAGTGAAIRVGSGSARIDNSGRIEGALLLGDRDDQVTNTGTLVMTADNDFGAGADLFTNSGGTVRLGKAAAPLKLSFLGLERFANEGGLIDLRNEWAGDTLTLSGAYSGSGDARLALDVGPDAADSLVVQGATSGMTSIILQARPQDATLLDESLTLIKLVPGASAGAFTLADSDVGLIRYQLTFDAKASAYMLDAGAGRAVEQSVLAGEGLVAAWRASADAFSTEQAMARAAGGEGSRVWAQLHGSFIEGNDHGAADAARYDNDLVGGQMGVSLYARPMLGGLTAFGLTGGYVDSELTFADGGQDVQMRSVNAGAYGVWRAEKLFVTGLVKVDQHSLEIDDPAAGFEAKLDGVSWGGRLTAGYRMELGELAFEPTIGLDYLNSTLDDLNVLAQRVTFDDHDGLSARVGGQLLGRRGLADGRAISWSAGLEAVHDFSPEFSGALASSGETDGVLIRTDETYGRAQIGAQFELGRGVEAFVQGEGRFGESQNGGGLRIGARYRF